jgi:hypothetical protein
MFMTEPHTNVVRSGLPMTALSAAEPEIPITRVYAESRLWWVALAALCAILAAPLLLCDVPPLLDYPNHLGRWFVLASLPHDLDLAQFYAPRWSVIPNLALDLVAPPLIQLLPVHVAGRLLVAICVLLPVLGTVAYNTALGGRWWSLGVGLLAYNSCLLYGFLNFSFALGVALLLAAAWLRWREAYPLHAIAIAMAGAVLLFICHLMGLVFFAALVGGAELFRIYDEPHRLLAAVERGGVLLLIFAAPAILYSVSELQQIGGDPTYLPIGGKLFEIINVFTNYNRILDIATAAVVIGLPALCLGMRWGRVPRVAAVPMVLLLIAFFTAPFAWKGTFHVDTRLAVMLAFILFAGFVPGRWPRRTGSAAVTALVVLFATRMALLTTAWAAHGADIADVRRVLAPVQPGQAVYVASSGIKESPAYWAANPRWRMLSDGFRTDAHLGALVLIERRAWWPFEFDNASQQPLETKAPYRALADAVGALPDRDEAAAADVCGFDYILLTEADAVPDLPAERFHLLVRSGFAAMYGITRCRP